MNNYKSAGHKIATINRLGTIYFNNELPDIDLHGPGQMRIILALSRCEDGITQEELAHHLLVDKASISRMIRPLVDGGIILREKDPQDLRAYRLHLSDAAREKMGDIQQKAHGWTEILMAGFSTEERELCFSFLDRMLESAHEHLKGTCHGKKKS